MPIFCALLLAVFLAGGVPSLHAEETAMERLAQARYFGFASDREEQDYYAISESKTASEDFLRLLNVANPQARAYALVGLYRVDRFVFVERAALLRDDPTPVSFAPGNFVLTKKMGDFVREIAVGKYPIPRLKAYDPESGMIGLIPHDATFSRLAGANHVEAMSIDPVSGKLQCANRDFLELLDGKTGVEDCLELLRCGTLEAQFYAVVGLARLEPATFRRIAPALRSDPEGTMIPEGLWGSTSVRVWSLKEFVAAVADGSYPPSWTEEEKQRLRKEQKSFGVGYSF